MFAFYDRAKLRLGDSMAHINNLIHISTAFKYSELPFAEQLLLWGVRMWAQAFNQGVDNYEILNKAFCLAGVKDAYKALDEIMNIFATSGQGVININCPQCSCITIDENRIMGAVAAWQREVDPLGGNVFIRSWIQPAALRFMRLPAYQLAEILKQGNLNIRQRTSAYDFQFKDKIFTSKHQQNQYVH